MIDYMSVTITAIFTGIGVAIGTPIGQWVFSMIKEHKKKLKNVKLEELALSGKGLK